MTENWSRGLPRDKKSMAQDEVGSGTEGSQEGPEGACGLSRQFLSSTKGRRDSSQEWFLGGNGRLENAKAGASSPGASSILPSDLIYKAYI